VYKVVSLEKRMRLIQKRKVSRFEESDPNFPFYKLMYLTEDTNVIWLLHAVSRTAHGTFDHYASVFGNGESLAGLNVVINGDADIQFISQMYRDSKGMKIDKLLGNIGIVLAVDQSDNIVLSSIDAIDLPGNQKEKIKEYSKKYNELHKGSNEDEGTRRNEPKKQRRLIISI